MSRIDNLLCCAKQNLLEAQKLHPPIQSPHEGYAVIQEEVDELWEAIKEDNLETACKEAFHIAAMALRFVNDLYESP